MLHARAAPLVVHDGELHGVLAWIDGEAGDVLENGSTGRGDRVELGLLRLAEGRSAVGVEQLDGQRHIARRLIGRSHFGRDHEPHLGNVGVLIRVRRQPYGEIGGRKRRAERPKHTLFGRPFGRRRRPDTEFLPGPHREPSASDVHLDRVPLAILVGWRRFGHLAVVDHVP